MYTNDHDFVNELTVQHNLKDYVIDLVLLRCYAKEEELSIECSIAVGKLMIGTR